LTAPRGYNAMLLSFFIRRLTVSDSRSLGGFQVRALGCKDRTGPNGLGRRPPADLRDAILGAVIVVLAQKISPPAHAT
jgi:hypothetical protein